VTIATLLSLRDPGRMKRLSIPRALLTLAFVGTGIGACYVEPAGPREECRSVEVRNRHDVEVCRVHCNDNGCREHCAERERWSREHRCWVE
jgi:hypothetical protein